MARLCILAFDHGRQFVYCVWEVLVSQISSPKIDIEGLRL